MGEMIQLDGLTKVFHTRKRVGEKKWYSFKANYFYEDITAVKNLNFSVDEGEIFGFLGPNGAGKTTTIKMLCSLIEPTEGTAWVGGYDVSKQASKVRKEIGVVLAGERSCYWKLTGRENLRYYGALYHVSPKILEKRIEEVLAMVGLQTKGDELVEKYSTGMKQRLAIAKSLVHDPKILFLDEPTVGLDPAAARSVREMILHLQKEYKKTIILTTHYMEEADYLSDRVGIIHHGEIIALDTPESMKASLKGARKVIVELENVRDNFVNAIRQAACSGGDYYIQESANTICCTTENPLAFIAQSIEIGKNCDCQFKNIKIIEPTLEEVFLQLTGFTLQSQ